MACAERVAPRRVCVEFRNRTWMSPENQEETLAFLADHQLPYVCVDEPQGYPSSIPPVLAATSDLAVVRMHGHSDKWDSKSIQEKFGYRYSDGELDEWATKIRDLAGDAEVTHVVFNNCYRNYAQVNGQHLAEQLGGLARRRRHLTSGRAAGQARWHGRPAVGTGRAGGSVPRR